MLGGLIACAIGWGLAELVRYIFKGPISWWKAGVIGFPLLCLLLAIGPKRYDGSPSVFFPILVGAMLMMVTRGYTGKSRKKADTVHKPSVEKPILEPVEEHKAQEPVKKEKSQMSKAHDDEKFFEQVAAELEEGSRKKGLWLKAETKAGGDEDKARLLYIEWRVEQLAEEEREGQRKEEERLAKEAEEEHEAQRTKEERQAKEAAELEAKNQKEEPFDSTEALDELKQHGYTWQSDYSFAGDFRGWLILKGGYEVVRLKSKAELREWIRKNIPS